MGDSDQKALNALAKGAGITAIGMMISKALTYIYRVSIARFVGPEAYGQLSLGLMVIGIGSTIAYLSLGSSLQKFIPEFRNRGENARVRGVVLSALQMTLPLSILLTALIFFGADFIAIEIFENPELVPILKVLSFSIVLGIPSSIFFDTTLGFNKIIYKTVSVRIIQNIVQVGVTLILLLLGFQVISAAWGWIAGSIASLILGLYVLEKKIGPILFSRVKPVYQHRKMLRFSGPLILSGMIGTLMGWADTGFLGYYMTDFEVGLYNAALPTAMLILLPHKAIGSLALPSFSELKERNEEGVESSLKTATYWVFSLVLPTFLILLFFSEQTLHILFGSEYRAASMALSILAGGYLFDAVVGRVGSFLQSKGYTRYILYNNIAALTLNLCLNIVLIPMYGIIGAAVATASSTILTNLLMFIEVWKKEDIISIPNRKILQIIIVGLVPLAAVIGLDSLLFVDTPYWFLFPAGIIYYTLYILTFIKFIGLEDEEKEVILRTGEKLGYREKIKSVLEKLDELL
ncbi:polysaccharide biosynthesis protein [Candidatus Haloredivivus sp. G17]|jgi:O-antigen/teichoic acid export membrane protein|nr:polysaccharide biosynthesis protein [Candidatus Haloredivivus sp. G17]